MPKNLAPRLMAALLALGAGCSFLTSFDPEGKPCGEGDTCLDGFVCDPSGVCVHPSSSDAGRDGGPSSDAGRADGGR
jgi:hypothetical protein